MEANGMITMEILHYAINHLASSIPEDHRFLGKMILRKIAHNTDDVKFLPRHMSVATRCLTFNGPIKSDIDVFVFELMEYVYSRYKAVNFTGWPRESDDAESDFLVDIADAFVEKHPHHFTK